MHLLGLIFMNGDCATEEAICELLNKMRVYAGKRHFVFGEKPQAPHLAGLSVGSRTHRNS